MIEREIEWRAPVNAFRPHWRDKGAVLLHGGEQSGADWSFIALSPSQILDFDAAGERDPFAAARRIIGERRRHGSIACGAPFARGIIAFVGYECARFIEPQLVLPPSPFSIPDCRLAVYDAVAAFDRKNERLFLTGADEACVDALAQRMKAKAAPPEISAALRFLGSSPSRARYRADVLDIIGRIRRGDLYQANISQRLDFALEEGGDWFSLFEAAAEKSSAPFGVFASFGEAALICLSPERFFRIKAEGCERRIIAEPVKGTRPRGGSREEDERLAAELLASAKDRAENVMIADLTRNDLSKICKDGSIREEAICALESFESVHHLVSRISGELSEGLGAADALGALFPCGSITGAPKIAAMEAIAAIEREGRGPYCGAVGYIDDRGGADFAVGIRLAVAEGARLSARSGGGVTLQSDPQAEYQETLDKARWLAGLSDAGGETP